MTAMTNTVSGSNRTDTKIIRCLNDPGLDLLTNPAPGASVRLTQRSSCHRLKACEDARQIYMAAAIPMSHCNITNSRPLGREASIAHPLGGVQNEVSKWH